MLDKTEMLEKAKEMVKTVLTFGAIIGVASVPTIITSKVMDRLLHLKE